MEPNHRAQSSTNITQELASLTIAKSECSIYRVHNHLRNINAKAYEPEIISIGPYHCGKDNLKMMQGHKWHYIHSLLERKNETIDKLFDAIAPLEEEACKCYAEPFNFTPTEFTKMMVLDGCFIIELVRKCHMKYLGKEDDPIFRMAWIMNSLLRDLMLFENQIPFFVLSKLLDLIEGPHQENRFIALLVSFFVDLYPAAGTRFKEDKIVKPCNELYPAAGRRCKEDKIVKPHKIKHILDLMHSSWRPSFDCFNFEEYTKGDHIDIWRFINSASQLMNANVKFEKNDEFNSLFDATFKSGTLLLPTLGIEDKTESIFRNLVAYEQYFPEAKFNFVTDYVMFIDCLVNSKEDVEILRRFGIFQNHLGDGEVVANMFNKLTDSVTGPGKYFLYTKLFESTNVHCKKRRNSWMAKLRRNYLNSPWAILSIVAAIVLLLLTVTQTVFSILQVA